MNPQENSIGKILLIVVFTTLPVILPIAWYVYLFNDCRNVGHAFIYCLFNP